MALCKLTCATNCNYCFSNDFYPCNEFTISTSTGGGYGATTILLVGCELNMCYIHQSDGHFVYYFEIQLCMLAGLNPLDFRSSFELGLLQATTRNTASNYTAINHCYYLLQLQQFPIMITTTTTANLQQQFTTTSTTT